MLCRPPIPSEPGVYLLILRSTIWQAIRIDRRGARVVALPPGIYVYVGSAWGPGGLRARIYRHVGLTRRRRLHWHIDRLLASQYVKPIAALYAVGCKGERSTATLLGKVYEAVPGFGASDDPANNTHLYRITPSEEVAEESSASTTVIEMLEKLASILHMVCGVHPLLVNLETCESSR